MILQVSTESEEAANISANCPYSKGFKWICCFAVYERRFVLSKILIIRVLHMLLLNFHKYYTNIPPRRVVAIN